MIGAYNSEETAMAGFKEIRYDPAVLDFMRALFPCAQVALGRGIGLASALGGGVRVGVTIKK